MANRIEFETFVSAAGFKRGMAEMEAAANATNQRLQNLLRTKITAVESRMAGMDPDSWEYVQANQRRATLERTMLNVQNAGFLRNSQARKAIQDKETREFEESEAARVTANREALDSIVRNERDAAYLEDIALQEELARREQQEVDSAVRGASRANRARAMWRQRAEARLATASAAEQEANSGMGWWTSDSRRQAAAAATIERETAQSRLAGLTSAAYAARQLEASLVRGGHAAGGLSGIIRETAVVIREIAQGRGVGRIIGSLSLLGQYLWKGFLTALLSIPGLLAIAGGAIAYFIFHRIEELNKALDKTGELLEKGVGDRLKATEEAMKKAADAAANLKEHLAALADTHETLRDKMVLSLEAMREEFELMRQLASLRGESKAQELKAEQNQRRQELELLNETLQRQIELRKEAEQAEIDANEAAYTSTEAVQRQARINDMPGTLDQAREDLKKYQEFQREIEAKIEKANRNIETEAWAGQGTDESDADIQAKIAQQEAEVSQQPFTVKSGEAFSQEQIAGLIGKTQALVNELPKELARLEETQRELADAAAKAATGDTKAAEDVKELTKQRDELQRQISLHDKYDPRIAAADAAEKSRRAGLPGGDPLVRAGNFLGTARSGIINLAQEHIKIAKEQLGHLRSIDGKMGGSMTGTHFSGS